MADASLVNLKKVDKLSETRVRLDLEVTEDKVAHHMKVAATKYQKTAKIPGFRPGKAPLQMVSDRYKDQIEKDVLSYLLEGGLATALQEAKLYPINQPKIQVKESGMTGKALQFNAEFEITPDIKLGKYKGIPVKSPKVNVGDKQVNQAIDELRDRVATLEPLETDKLKKGDFAVVKVGFEILDGDKRKDEPKEFTVEVGEEKLLPEVDKALLAMKMGERRKDVKAKFPENYADKVLANRPVNFDIELIEAKKKVLPEANDDFAAQIQPGLTLEKLKKQLHDEITENHTRERTEHQRQQVLDHLTKNHKFEPPASMVAQRTKFLMDRVEEDLKRRGQAFPDLTDKDLKELKARAENQVCGSLLLAEISKKEEIKLDQSRVDMRVNMISKQLNRTPDEALKWLEGKGYLSQIRDEVLTDQVFDFLLKNANLTETEGSKKAK